MVNPRPKINFFTNHSYVLALLWRLKGAPLRIIAHELGLTERSVQGIVSDLEKLGAIQREKVGRTNSYTINRNTYLSGILEGHRTVQEIIKFLEGTNLGRDAQPNLERPRSTAPKSSQKKLLVTLR